MSYRCATCGQTHDDLPDLAFRWPDPYFVVPEAERSTRIRGTLDLCSIDDDQFYIRGVILIPIKGHNEKLGLGVWVSQKRENFRTYVDNYESADIGPFFGWLSNSIPFYKPDTWALKTMAHFQGPGKRPSIVVEPSGHPLYIDYAEGVGFERAASIVRREVETDGT
jgi:hypothetical protein